MSEADVVVRLSVETARLTAALNAFSRMIGYEVLPVLQRLNVVLKAWYQTRPGMPYTGPSLWEPEQMIGDSGAEKCHKMMGVTLH